jgi:hypothetical protein
MKYFAEFYKLSTGYVEGSIPPRFDGPVKFIRALGDRGTILIDGRLDDYTIHAIAADECKKRGFLGYKIGINSTGNVSRFFSVQDKTDLETASSR